MPILKVNSISPGMKHLLYFLLLVLLSCGNKNQSIRIKGSDTEVNLAVDLAENYYPQNPNYSIAISGGGSGLGIASLLNGQTDIANSSRPLNSEEIKMFKSRGIQFRTVIFAEDATAIIVQKNFPLDTISISDLKRVFDGEYKTWKKLTGKKTPITIYGRQSNSGTHVFIGQKLQIDFSPDAKEMNGNAQIMESIKMDPSGIGYVGVGYILVNSNQSLKVLKITATSGKKSISPIDKGAILKNQYFFQRPLYQYILEASWPKVSSFIAFEKGLMGKRIIQSSGYYILEN